MIYAFSIEQLSVWAGLGLILSHGWAWCNYGQASGWLRAFPRGDGFGGLLLVLATGWSAWLAGSINLMEYTRFRPLFILGVVGLGVTSWLYVREFIAVRALGILFLLAGDVFLDAAFLRVEGARLLVVSYAYLLIVEGMFMVGAPYLLRDAIALGLATTRRGKCFLGLGVGFGVVLVGLGLFVF